MALSKDDLEGVHSVVREELAVTEERLTKKIEDQAEGLAQMSVREFDRLHKAIDVHARRVDRLEERVEKLARHVGYPFEK